MPCKLDKLAGSISYLKAGIAHLKCHTALWLRACKYIISEEMEMKSTKQKALFQPGIRPNGCRHLSTVPKVEELASWRLILNHPGIFDSFRRRASSNGCTGSISL